MDESVSWRWVDSHCHLDFPVFDNDRLAVIERARASGVTNFVVPGIAAASWQRVVALKSEPGIHVSFGLHPWLAAEHRPEHMEILKKLLVSSRAVAIGECGLDYSCNVDIDVQRHWFLAQLRLAADLGLPVIVHAVRAMDEVLHEFSAFSGLTGVIHSFAGSKQQVEKCVNAGFMVGIGPHLMRSSRLRESVAAIPLDNLLLETDSPDRPIVGFRGEPAHILLIAEAVAAIKKVAPEKLAQITSTNAQKMFAWENS